MDKQGRIRGYYDGTDELKVNKLIEDIEVDVEGFISGLIDKLVVIGETLGDNYFKITNYPVIKKSSTSKQNQ